ncbi:MAG: hypothetical protein GXO15_02710 [Crenarchaeota archaeon]|nr:hypothetical protein [Thermoproteota archaeon]
MPVVGRGCRRLGDLNVYQCAWDPSRVLESVVFRVSVEGVRPGLREVVVSLSVRAGVEGYAGDVDGSVVYRCRVDPWRPVCTFRHPLLPWWVPGVHVELGGKGETRLGLVEGHRGIYLLYAYKPGSYVVQYGDGVVDVVYGLAVLRLSSGVCCVGELGRPVRLAVEPEAILKSNVVVSVSPEAVICVACGYALCAVSCGSRLRVGRGLVCVPDSLDGECRVEVAGCGRHEVYTLDIRGRVEALLRLAAAAAGELAELLKHVPAYLTG